jgi:glycerophosphoryl diester phosphodiesterase
MKTITLDNDYTRNGLVVWPQGVAVEATDELRQLLADGVAGTETDTPDTDPVQAPAQDAAADQPQA